MDEHHRQTDIKHHTALPNTAVRYRRGRVVPDVIVVDCPLICCTRRYMCSGDKGKIGLPYNTKRYILPNAVNKDDCSDT